MAAEANSGIVEGFWGSLDQVDIALFAVVASLIAIVVTLWGQSRQRRFELNLLRYEAVRSKRATAKALRAEIDAILMNRSNEIMGSRVVFEALAKETGQLDEESIMHVVHYYCGEKADIDSGMHAIKCLDDFLSSTEHELRELKKILKVLG